jgi:chitin disaccharide deacetylase
MNWRSLSKVLALCALPMFGLCGCRDFADESAADPDSETNGPPIEAEKYFLGAPPAGIVYLTFDDGPINATQGILDVLKANQVRATFFLNGFHLYGEGDENEDKAAESLNRTLRERHVIGNHSYDHMLHNCCDDQGACGAAVCNKIAKWNIKSYQNEIRDTESFYSNVKKIRDKIANTRERRSNDYLQRLGRLPYTNGWRSKTMEIWTDCPCCTSDDLPPWDPAFKCSADQPTMSAVLGAAVGTNLHNRGYEMFGWDLEWSPENWGDPDPVSTMTTAEKFAEMTVKAMSTCMPPIMEPFQSRAPHFPCDTPLHKKKVVVLVHDFLYEDGTRGKGATVNLPKLDKYIKLMMGQGYIFDTAEKYSRVYFR